MSEDAGAATVVETLSGAVVDEDTTAGAGSASLDSAATGVCVCAWLAAVATAAVAAIAAVAAAGAAMDGALSLIHI